jgi:hypothetical protein
MDDFFCYWVEVSPSRPPASTIYRHGGAENTNHAQAASREHETAAKCANLLATLMNHRTQKESGNHRRQAATGR